MTTSIWSIPKAETASVYLPSLDEDGDGFIVTERASGYAHERLSGVCAEGKTSADVAKRFYHEAWGGRDAWARDGQFGVVIHTD